MEQGLSYAAAFVVGLLGGVHCVGMCGGIVGALSFGLDASRRSDPRAMLPLLLAYNLGRIASYGLAGLLAGGLGMLLASSLPVWYAQRALLLLAGLFMLGLGLYLGGWWFGLSRIEQLGGALWRRIEPRARRWMPVRSASQALMLGVLWGWVPCGLVYSVLVWTLSTGSPLHGAGLMLAFGFGTLPNLLLMGVAAATLAGWLRRREVRQVAGSLVAGFGLFTLWQAW